MKLKGLKTGIFPVCLLPFFSTSNSPVPILPTPSWPNVKYDFIPIKPIQKKPYFFIFFFFFFVNDLLFSTIIMNIIQIFLT